MIDRRDLLKFGAAATVGAGLGSATAGAQDDETPTGTPTGTGTETPEEMLTGDLYAAARMTGMEQETPVETDARGTTAFTQEDDGSLGYDMFVAAIENVTQAHIHLAPEGEGGPVVQWLYPSAEAEEPQLLEGEFEGLLASDTITGDNLVGPLEGGTLDDLVSEIEAGNAYVNVHTEENPGGEIRGQIWPVEMPTAPDGTPAETPEGTPTESPTPDETPAETPTETPGETLTETPAGTPTEGTPTPGDGTPTPTPEE